MKNVNAAVSDFLSTYTTAHVADLYTITPRVGSAVRWTDAAYDISLARPARPDDPETSGSVTFYAGGEGTTHPLIERDEIEEHSGTETSSITLTLKCGEAALFNGVRVPSAARDRAFFKARVKVERVYMGTPGDTSAGVVHRFEGTVAEVEPASTEVTLTVSSLEDYDVPFPRTLLQPPCGNILFDGLCGLSKATWTVTGTVSAGATATSIPTSLTNGAGYFNLGVIKFTSGALNGVQRGMRAYSQTAGTVTPDRALPSAPVDGTTFTIVPGCDKTKATCATKFSNLARFRGFPYLPRRNPSYSRDGRPRPGKLAPDYVRPTRIDDSNKSGELAIQDEVLPLVYGKTRVKLIPILRTWVANEERYDAIFAVAEGEIAGAGMIWLNGEVLASWTEIPAQLRDLKLGTRPTQTASTIFAARDAIASQVTYPGAAHLVLLGCAIEAGATESYELEVHGITYGVAGPPGDSTAVDVLQDMITNTARGLGRPLAEVVVDVGQDGSVNSSARRYVGADALKLSPALTTQKSLLEWIDEILASSNLDCVWSEGKFKVLPLCDTTVVGTSVTYTPCVTIRKAFGPDNILGDGPNRITLTQKPPAETYNICPVEFLARETPSSTDPGYRYQPDQVEDPDPASVDEIGTMRAEPVALHMICDRDTAQKVSRIRAQRSSNILNTYTWRTTFRDGALLEPLDLVTLTDDHFGLSNTVVRIKSIKESREYEYEITAEEWTFSGLGTATTYTPQTSENSWNPGPMAPYLPARSDLSNVPPNTVTPPLIIEDVTGGASVDMASGRIVFDNGAVVKASGIGFGAGGADTFLEWAGLRSAILTGGIVNVALCTRANAIQYLATNGDAYFGGTLAAGVIRNSGRTTVTAATAEITVGPFGTNGGARTVVVSYDFYAWRDVAGNQSGSGAVSAEIRVYKTVGAGAETLLSTLNVSGSWEYLGYEPETQTTTQVEDMSGSQTVTDSGDSGEQITYRAAIFSRTLEFQPITNQAQQTLGIVSSE